VAVRSNRVVGIFHSVIDFVGDGLADAELLADFREQAIVYFFPARACRLYGLPNGKGL
jgi:hypothetical protein